MIYRYSERAQLTSSENGGEESGGVLFIMLF